MSGRVIVWVLSTKNTDQPEFICKDTCSAFHVCQHKQPIPHHRPTAFSNSLVPPTTGQQRYEKQGKWTNHHMPWANILLVHTASTHITKSKNINHERTTHTTLQVNRHYQKLKTRITPQVNTVTQSKNTSYEQLTPHQVNKHYTPQVTGFCRTLATGVRSTLLTMQTAGYGGTGHTE